MKICHITTVHPPFDIRIFVKECSTLAMAGHEVTLLVAGEGEDTVRNGVRVERVPVSYRTRIGRMIKAPRALYRRVAGIRPEVVHFHDPEFLMFAGRLKRRGIKVIYDAHEDVPRQILSKYWIPRRIRSFVAAIVERYENRRAAKLDHIVTATSFIADRFRKINPGTTDIRNYPLTEEFNTGNVEKATPPHLCYIGGISGIRGIKELIRAMEGCDAVLDLAGPVESCELFHELKQLPGWKKKVYHGVVDREQVAELMSGAVAGIVLFHPVPNHVEAMPTKLFEYMLAGIPVVASNFDAWKKIVEELDCGICVDPLDVDQIREAIRWMVSNPVKAAEMGRNGREAALEHYTWDIEKKKLLQVYEDLLKG